MKKKQIFYLIFLIVATLILFFPTDWAPFLSKFNFFEKKSEDFLSNVLPRKITNPGPLRFLGNSFSSNLTKEKVLISTNKERVKAEMSPLKFSLKLNKAAELKVDDMFKQQYFAHVSPKGISVSELAENVEYEYIIVGENLALGNFKDEKELVDAWMASPGHKANILTKRYEEIGIAVKLGEFEGKKAWLAVQTFGTPTSSCGLVDISLKNKINNDKNALADLESDLKTKMDEINAAEPKRGRDYNLKLEEYNLIVSEYNFLIKSIKESITKYNEEVEGYNKCAQGE